MKADYIVYNSLLATLPMNNNKPQFKNIGFAMYSLLTKWKRISLQEVQFWEISIKEAFNISW